MKTQAVRFYTLGLTLAFAAALCIWQQTAVQALAPPPSTVAAADIERWRVTNGFYVLNVFGDGTILAASDTFVNGPGSGVKLNPSTGATIAPFFGPDVRTSIRLGVGGEQDWVVGGYVNRPAYRQDGSFATDLFPGMGCCNIPRHPLALDPVNDQAYLHANNAKGGVIMSTSSFTGWNYDGVDSAGMISISDPDTFYSAGERGHVVRWPASGVNLWSVAIDSTYLQPGAVTADGSFVVTSGAPHLTSFLKVPGRLARVMPNGNVAWNYAVNAVTPPVIGGNGLIFVGTQTAPIDPNGSGAINAYDPADGTLVWSTAVDGLPNDLLVGDDGAVYAGTGTFSNGNVYAIGQSDGEIRRVITSVPGAWEIILRAGLLYASGTSITALPVAANNYDPNSPWPVRFHDNQRTGNRQAPILTPSRDPGPDPVAPSTSASNSPGANVAGWNNTNTNVLLAAEDNNGGSGVASITYSANGAQAIAATTVNAATTALTISAEGETTITYHASDVAGNQESPKTIVIKIDKTAPTISVTSPTAGSYLLNQTATIAFNCTDSLSGVASCTGSSPNGSALDTASIGAKSLTIAATDLAGNTSVPTVVSYTVAYGVVALYDQAKTHKSGSTIPIKIRLVDASGADVSSPSTVVHAASVIQISNQASTNFGDSGNSNPDFDFRYDASLGGYIFNLQTTGFGTGSYLLSFVAGNSPTVYSVGFQVRQ